MSTSLELAIKLLQAQKRGTLSPLVNIEHSKWLGLEVAIDRPHSYAPVSDTLEAGEGVLKWFARQGIELKQRHRTYSGLTGTGRYKRRWDRVDYIPTKVMPSGSPVIHLLAVHECREFRTIRLVEAGRPEVSEGWWCVSCRAKLPARKAKSLGLS